MNKKALKLTVGEFTWAYGEFFYIETSRGNFVWSDPDYNGSNRIWPTKMSCQAFMDKFSGGYGRDKGKHLVGKYCGDFVLMNTLFES